MSNTHQQRNTRYNTARLSGVVDPQDSFSVVVVDSGFYLNRKQRDDNLFTAKATKDGTESYFDKWETDNNFNPFPSGSLYGNNYRLTGTAFYGGLSGSGDKPEDKFVAEHLPVTSGNWPDGTGKRGNFTDVAQSGASTSSVARYDFKAFTYRSPDNKIKEIDIQTGSISGVSTITKKQSAPDMGSSYDPKVRGVGSSEPQPPDPEDSPEEEDSPATTSPPAGGGSTGGSTGGSSNSSVAGWLGDHTN